MPQYYLQAIHCDGWYVRFGRKNTIYFLTNHRLACRIDILYEPVLLAAVSYSILHAIPEG